ncbi:hypothetical protein [Shouchella lonarensis]|uniref:Uncharacterized protein n=1 Tax=Shouchella lonarensis TaxID=1464122 RepID=A0A1G6GG81_9BACI|nr:hypothetical protein [Shouchella lonarensis]SDB81018.1 hypothetical protein SAMN05421737_10110 [Shouchella lonarensis]
MTKKRVVFVVATAVVIGSILTKKEWRTNACKGMRQAKQKVSEAVTFMKDNRAHIMEETKEALQEMRGLGQEIVTDVTTVVEAVSHLRTSSKEALHVAKEALGEIKEPTDV